ncbi:MAG: NIPSNAP family protein [Limisphaerales bacterium]
MIRYLLSIIAVVAAFTAFADDAAKTLPPPPSPAKDSRFFEMRTYHAAPGKLQALNARFRDFTNKLFVKHGMEMIGYWVPVDKEGKPQDTLVYILAFPSHAARDKAWREFTDDIEWQAVKAETEKNGPLLVGRPESVFMTPTDYSPIK